MTKEFGSSGISEATDKEIEPAQLGGPMSADEKANGEAGRPKEVPVGGAVEVDVALPVTAWLSARHAENWLRDAIEESERPEERHAFERELVLACCFAESFLFEYLRDFVFLHRPGKHDWHGLRDFLSRRVDGGWELRRAPIELRWKTAGAWLAEEGRLTDRPRLPEDFDRLVKFRNNLVHGNVVIPRDGREGDESLGEPTPTTIRELGRGWPTRTALIAARRFHEANVNELDPPPWLYDVGIEPTEEG